MNERVNKFLLVGNKVMTEISHSQDLLIVLVDHLLKRKKEYKSLKSRKIQDIFTKMN